MAPPLPSPGVCLKFDLIICDGISQKTTVHLCLVNEIKVKNTIASENSQQMALKTNILIGGNILRNNLTPIVKYIDKPKMHGSFLGDTITNK